MDEFFNFDDASRPISPLAETGLLSPGPYDVNLAFAQPEHDEDSFTCLQHFTAPEQSSLELHNAVHNTTMMGPDDFTDFPRWIDGMDVPTQPCEYCHRMKTHCKVLKEGTRKGSCTSCVALAKSCSLTSDLKTPLESFPVAFTAENHGDAEFENWNTNMTEGPSTQNASEDLDPFSHSGSATDLMALRSSNESLVEAAESGPKVGARFSRESVRILRGWLSTHQRHPYPTYDEKESLRQQTGLNMTQITNWLANARRRGTVRAPRSTSPSPQQYANGMDIARRGTPSPQEMNPLERWKHSPPEHEPASVTAIAKAVSSSSFQSSLDSPLTSYGHTDDGSARSLCNVSSTGSIGTSQSSVGSFVSAFSHKSRGSFGSFNSFSNRGTRRRRRQVPKLVSPSPMTQAPRTFQCTFCTETFKTKHDWQRHEKSLHLSLERWICSPNGPTQLCSETNHISCVYCGAPNSLEGHAEQHNHSSCAERSIEERTFYRKDHLRQHLKLVHDVKFQNWSMDSWKVATPEIRSRCGFCGIVMDSWRVRVDHLAEHFKSGKSMADWKGDWGFEPQVLDVVENGMPPCKCSPAVEIRILTKTDLIHDERNTLNPYEASIESAKSGKTLEDLVKLGLVDYINDRVVIGAVPTDEDLLVEAQKIIRKADATDDSLYDTGISWFRDIIMLSGTASQGDNPEQLQNTGFGQDTWDNMTGIDNYESINARNPLSMRDLSTIHCSKERALMEYVQSQQALGLTPTDSELQIQACKILDDGENTTSFKCKGAVQWFKFLIASSPNWLAAFRRRAGLPRSSEMGVDHIRSSDDKTIDYSIHNLYRLERELGAFVQLQQAIGKRPTDADLQRQARLIIYGNDDPWNQTAVDDAGYLHVFKKQNGLAPSDADDVPMPSEAGGLGSSLLSASVQPYSAPSPRTLHWDLETTGIGLPSPVSGSDQPGASTHGQPLHTLPQKQPSANTKPTKPLRYFLNDVNCYGRLVRELSRFVTSCLSPNNPLQHVCLPPPTPCPPACPFQAPKLANMRSLIMTAPRSPPMPKSKTKPAGSSTTMMTPGTKLPPTTPNG